MAHPAHAIDSAREPSRYIRDQWGTARGFPGGQVYAITQTADGYLWIGAEKGLVRFDGLNFQLFNHANTQIIPAGPIRSLVADGEGGLWIHLGGPRVLRYANKKFEDVAKLLPPLEPAFTAMSSGTKGDVIISALVSGTLKYKDGKFVKLAGPVDLPNFLVISLAEQTDGKLWLGTRDLGLFYATHGAISNIGKPLPDKKINCLLPFTNEDLWIGTDKGVVRWNGAEITTTGLSPALTRVQALTMLRDRDANVWVGTSNGLIRVNAQGTVDFSQRDNSLPVTALFEDREGNIWAGTSQGLERLRESIFVSYSGVEGVPVGNNGPIYMDGDNRLWFGPATGGLYSLKSGRVERVTSAGLDHDVIYSITGDKSGLWIGRQTGGLTHLSVTDGSYKDETFKVAQGLAQNSVYSVSQNRDGSVWAGTLSGGVSQLRNGKFKTYTTTSGLASNTIDAIVEGADGTMWFATPSGLSSLAKDRWQTFQVKDGLPSDRVNCLLEDSSGVLWVGTDDGLAFYYQGQFHVQTNLPEPLRNQILGIAIDDFQSLWIATSDHVLRVARDNLVAGNLTAADITEFGRADGLRGTEGLRRNRSVAKDRSGLIWFSLTSGLSSIDPRSLKRALVPAVTHITSLVVDGSPIEPVGNILVPSGRQRIVLGFVGLSLAIPERVKYRYRLDGFDHEWSEPVSAGEAIYTNLGPGTYRFRVMASNSDGTWNSVEQTLGFEIARAFWQTLWFRLAVALTVGFIAFAIYRIHLLQVIKQLNVRFEERLAERTLIAQELHDTLLQGFLSASMQLDVAIDQLPEASPVKKRLMRVLDMMRQVNEEGRNALRGLRHTNDASQDIALALSNLSQELKGTNDSTFKVLVEGSARPLLPIVRDEVYRIGREAVINAFRHSHAKNITVEMSYLEKQLRFVVIDDGCGINAEVLQSGRTGHWGLSGMRERADRIKARLKVRSRVGSGTEVELSVPGNFAFQDHTDESRLKLFSRLLRRKPPVVVTETSKEVKQ